MRLLAENATSLSHDRLTWRDPVSVIKQLPLSAMMIGPERSSCCGGDIIDLCFQYKIAYGREASALLPLKALKV